MRSTSASALAIRSNRPTSLVAAAGKSRSAPRQAHRASRRPARTLSPPRGALAGTRLLMALPEPRQCCIEPVAAKLDLLQQRDRFAWIRIRGIERPLVLLLGSLVGRICRVLRLPDQLDERGRAERSRRPVPRRWRVSNGLTAPFASDIATTLPRISGAAVIFGIGLLTRIGDAVGDRIMLSSISPSSAIGGADR